MKSIAAFFVLILSCALAQAFQLSGFETPESAARDVETGAIFVSNANGDLTARDGNGYLSRINASGNVVIQKFIGGKAGEAVLDAPNGLAVWAGKLIVTDLDKVKIFDKKSGNLIREIDLAPLGAALLSDAVVNQAGVLYISDRVANKIFSFSLVLEGDPQIFREGADLGGPNGLTINPRSNNLLVATWDTGSVLEIDRAGRIHYLKRGLKNLNGIDFDDQWNLYVSSYTKGEVYRISFLGRGTLSVFAGSLNTPADISFDRRRRELIVTSAELGTLQSFPQSQPFQAAKS